jgi:hypothetical protein
MHEGTQNILPYKTRPLSKDKKCVTKSITERRVFKIEANRRKYGLQREEATRGLKEEHNLESHDLYF